MRAPVFICHSRSAFAWQSIQFMQREDIPAAKRNNESIPPALAALHENFRRIDTLGIMAPVLLEML
jgi:hypothetical protein